jgi:hypothetical protein
VAVGVTSVPPIEWVNRPTFQQVVQLPTADHYKCYKVSAVAPPFQPRTVTLVDQFETKTTLVRRPYAICNPVDKNGSGMSDPTAHLACYRIKDAAGQPPFAKRNVLMSNQFGDQGLTVRRARTLCLPAEKDGVASALNIDHFKCYKAGHPVPRFVPRTVTLADQFESKTTVVRKADSICTPVDKNGEAIKDAATHLTCYAIKDGRGQPSFASRNVQVGDQFGNELERAVRAVGLCVPSTKQLP